MHESFWFGTSLGDLFISGLTVNNAGAMVGACFFFFLLTVLFESLKLVESRMRKNHNLRMRKELEGACAGERSNLLAENSAIPGPSNRDIPAPPSSLTPNKYLLKFSQVLLYTVNTSINYIIMLAVMLYNAYLVIAVILGITLGYFIFGHIKSAYNMEIIEEKQQTVTVCAPGCEDPDGSTPPLLRSMGASENSNAYSCETRAQMQRLLEHSPTDSSDGQSTQETEVTVIQEQADVHTIAEVKRNDNNASVSCCKDTKNSSNSDDKDIISCCGNDNESVAVLSNDDNFKSCSEKNKNETTKDDHNVL